MLYGWRLKTAVPMALKIRFTEEKSTDAFEYINYHLPRLQHTSWRCWNTSIWCEGAIISLNGLVFWSLVKPPRKCPPLRICTGVLLSLSDSRTASELWLLDISCRHTPFESQIWCFEWCLCGSWGVLCRDSSRRRSSSSRCRPIAVMW